MAKLLREIDLQIRFSDFRVIKANISLRSISDSYLLGLYTVDLANECLLPLDLRL